MTINTRRQALAEADARFTNIPGTCQIVTRGYYNAPSVGDKDRDGASDAEDGWKSEPLSARHSDRHPPAGVPVTFGEGGNDFWHRAISRGKGEIRSTDFDGVTKRYSPGKVGNGTIEEIERAMGRPWVGWSDTINGFDIPKDDRTRGWRIDQAIRRLNHVEAKPGSIKAKSTAAALAALKKIPLRFKKV